MIVAETTGVSLAQADEVRRALGTPKGQREIEAWWRPAARRARLRPGRRRPDLGGAQGVRVVRVLQGARGGLRPADLPLGVAQDPPPGRVPRRGADPRPGHVPQAAHPRRRPQPRHRRARARRQRLHRQLPHRAARTDRLRPTWTPATGSPHRTPTCPTPAATASGCRWPTSRGSARRRWPGSSPGSPTPGWPTSGTAPTSHGRSPSASSSPAGSTASTACGSSPPGRSAPEGSGRRGRGTTRRDLLLHVAELDRYGRALERSATSGGTRDGRGRPAPYHRPSRRSTDRQVPGPGGGPVAGARLPVRTADAAADPARPRPRRPARAHQRHRPARADRPRARPRRARHPRPRRERARRRLLRPDARRPGRDPQPRPAAGPQPVDRVGVRGQGGHPDPADPVRAPGGLPHPRRLHRSGRRDLLRGRPGPLRRDGLPLVDAARARRGAAHRPAGHLAARDRGVGAHAAVGGVAGGGLEAVYAAMEATERAATEQAEAAEAAHQEQVGGGRRVLVHASGFRQSPYADIQPAGRGRAGLAPAGSGGGGARRRRPTCPPQLGTPPALRLGAARAREPGTDARSCQHSSRRLAQLRPLTRGRASTPADELATPGH